MAPKLALVALVSALISDPSFAQAKLENAPLEVAPADTVMTSKGMTANMFFEFLLAEIATQRDQRQVAAEAYIELARESGDSRIAQRAVEVSLALRDAELGIKATNLWLELEPDSVSAQQTLIALLLSSGKISQATPHIKNLLIAQPNSAARIFMQLGGLTGRYPDKDAVLILMKELVVDYQNIAEARFATAQAAKVAQQIPLAVSESNAALILNPKWELAALLHGELLARTDPQQAIKFYRDFLKSTPMAREVRTNLARQLASEKDFAAARHEFQALVTASPNTAEYYLALGVISVEMKDYAAAEKHLTRTLELNFRDPDTVRTYLGQLNEDQKRYKEAIAWYRQVASGESYFASQIRAASLMAKMGDLDGGRKFLSTVRASNSDQQSMVVITNAQMLRDAKQYESALDTLNDGLKSQPDSAELLYDRAMTAEKLNRLDVLEVDLRKVIALQPDHAHAYNALGYTLAERNIRLAEALQLIEKAYQLEPDDASILDSMGWVHYRLGNLDKGLNFLRRALASRPDPEIAAHLVEVLLAGGQRGEAKTISERALLENPDNEALLAVLRKLELK